MADAPRYKDEPSPNTPGRYFTHHLLNYALYAVTEAAAAFWPIPSFLIRIISCSCRWILNRMRQIVHFFFYLRANKTWRPLLKQHGMWWMGMKLGKFNFKRDNLGYLVVVFLKKFTRIIYWRPYFMAVILLLEKENLGV